MLVLTRKEGEKINIGQGIVVKVISISGNKVRVGVEAPADVRILRSELELDLDFDTPVTTFATEAKDTAKDEQVCHGADQ